MSIKTKWRSLARRELIVAWGIAMVLMLGLLFFPGRGDMPLGPYDARAEIAPATEATSPKEVQIMPWGSPVRDLEGVLDTCSRRDYADARC